MESKFKIGDIVYWLDSHVLIQSGIISTLHEVDNKIEYIVRVVKPSYDEYGCIMTDGCCPGNSIITHHEYYPHEEKELVSTREEAEQLQQEKSPLKGIDVSKLREQFECSFNPTKLGTSLHS